MGPDFRVLVNKARKSAQKYYLEYKTEIPVALMAREVATVMQEFTQSGGVRPFGVSLLLAGVDSRGPQLFQVDPSGSFWAWKASAIGKNANNAKTFLEKRYNKDMELEDAINTAILTLKEGFVENELFKWFAFLTTVIDSDFSKHFCSPLHLCDVLFSIAFAAESSEWKALSTKITSKLGSLEWIENSEYWVNKKLQIMFEKSSKSICVLLFRFDQHA